MTADRSPTRARDREGGRTPRPRKKSKAMWYMLLFFLAAPAGLAIWFFLQSAERQQEISDKVPPGWEDRAIRAGICIAALFVLAKLVLPALHGAAGGLRRALASMAAKPVWLRVLLFPIELVLWILYTVARLGFAADAVLIIALCLASLLLVGRILRPDLLLDYIPHSPW